MERTLRGRVSNCSKLQIGGWALSPEDELHRPEIEIVQRGEIAHILLPNIVNADIRPVLRLPKSAGHNLCRWQLMLPFSSGIAPDHPFTIRFRETKQPLEQGTDLRLPLFDPTAAEARARLDQYVFAVQSYNAFESGCSGALYVAARGLRSATLTVDGQPAGVALRAHANANGHVLGHPGAHLPYRCQERRGPHVVVSANLDLGDTDQPVPLDPSQSLYLPAELFNPAERVVSLPDGENVRRVAGKVDDLQFSVSGFMQFMQMSALTQRHFGRAFCEFETICDWGVGCGRVMRYFPDRTTGQTRAYRRLIGLDIDEYNIDWCKLHMQFADIHLLDRHQAIMPLERASVDLLYAISVMTHLSEYNQFRWLEEIERVVKPGGCVILTMNGETALYQRPELLQYYFTEKFGFSDLQPDTTFGDELSSYYRVTYQTQEFVQREWGRYFDILEIFPAKQDYVVMRRRT